MREERDSAVGSIDDNRGILRIVRELRKSLEELAHDREDA